jgi:hypothetical protein
LASASWCGSIEADTGTSGYIGSRSLRVTAIGLSTEFTYSDVSTLSVR